MSDRNGHLAEVMEPEPETEEERAHREVQQQIDTAVNESLESTSRMLAMASEAKEYGIKTLVFLDEQGEQLEKIEEGMDKINADMKEAEKSLEGLEKCCGLCVLPWNRHKPEVGVDLDSSWRNPNVDLPPADAPRPMASSGMAPTGPLIARITDDAREDEMEENLQQVSSMVQNLRNMAVDMGNEVDSQNKTIATVVGKAYNNQKSVNQATRRANKLL